MGRPRTISKVTGLPMTDDELREMRNARTREWKRKDRRKRGVALKGQHERKPRTPEQIENSRIKELNRKRTWKLQYNRINPNKRMLWAAKKRAKKKNREFSITLDDIKIPTHCPILGMELCSYSPRGICRDDVMSLDRIDITKGYIKGNVQVISHLANTLKNRATIEQLQMFAEYINREFPK